jgi:hypothetical protein
VLVYNLLLTKDVYTVIINMPGGLDDLEKVFAVMDFLDNKDELIKEFKPAVAKYLVKDGFFKGPFRRSYEKAFDELIVSLIKSEITKHFSTFTPEEILLLCDKDFLKIITNDYYFNKSNYSKEAKDEQTHKVQ